MLVAIADEFSFGLGLRLVSGRYQVVFFPHHLKVSRKDSAGALMAGGSFVLDDRFELALVL